MYLLSIHVNLNLKYLVSTRDDCLDLNQKDPSASMMEVKVMALRKKTMQIPLEQFQNGGDSWLLRKCPQKGPKIIQV